MAWLEPFIATLPQFIATVKEAPIFDFDHENDSDSRIPSNNEYNPTNATLHNLSALSMYQRAVTLQQTNSHDMNQQIFDISNNPSFDSSLLERSYSFNSNHSKHDIDESVLSDEQYIDLHSRLSFDELSDELYEIDTSPWFEMNVNENELVVNNKNKKLSEEQWEMMLKTIKKNKFYDKNITFVLNHIVLDKTASRYLHKLSMHMKQNKVKWSALRIQNAYFLRDNAQNNEDLYLMFTQTEGMNDEYDDEDLFLNDNCFDFNLFCESISRNKSLDELVINDTNLNDVLNDNEASRLFGDILSNHNALRTVNLSQNNIQNGSIFVDILLRRQMPLHCLNISDNPISANDIKAIKWAASKEYISPFEVKHEIDETHLEQEEKQFIESLFPMRSKVDLRLKMNPNAARHKNMMCNKCVFSADGSAKYEKEQPPGVVMSDDTFCNQQYLMLRI